jgi:hypothetical protein
MKLLLSPQKAVPLHLFVFPVTTLRFNTLKLKIYIPAGKVQVMPAELLVLQWMAKELLQ